MHLFGVFTFLLQYEGEVIGDGFFPLRPCVIADK